MSVKKRRVRTPFGRMGAAIGLAACIAVLSSCAVPEDLGLGLAESGTSLSGHETGITAVSLQTPSSSPAVSFSESGGSGENTVNVYGNTTGNLYNGGIAALQGNWIYYKTDTGLHKIRTDGTDRELFLRGAVDFRIADGWVYYTDPENRHLYRMKLDGTQKKKLIGEPVSNLEIADGTIY